MDAAARHQLIEDHYGLAHSCATKFLGRLPHGTAADHDAVRGAALEALVKCADRFDPARGSPFGAFAWFRMWGAMRDELRDADPVPRAVRARSREISAAGRRLHTELGRRATDSEVAAAAGCTLDELLQVRAAIQAAYLSSLDEIVAGEDGVDRRRFDIADLDADLVEAIANETLVAELMTALPERERLVVVLYYFEQLRLREIGELLGVTESRVSQLHTKALKRMRARAAA